MTDESALELHERTADQLFEVLGSLKGGVMKFGQVLSVYEAVLPPEISAVYRQRLARLQEAARPEAEAVVHGVLAEDLGADWRTMFVSFDDEPVAAASLAQVHRAVWRDGREVAVKVQYPEAHADLLGDRDSLVMVMGWFTRLVAPALDGRAMAEDLMDRLAEELDYAREAESQRAFRAGFAGSPEFRVPDVVWQQGRVLVSEWVGGTPLSAVIASGSQEERDRAGLLLTRLMFDAPVLCGRLHGDPHPGNFRLFDDGSLGVLDFGAVYRLTPGTESPLHKWMRIHLAETPDELLRTLRDVGFLRPGVRADAARLQELFAHSGLPAHSETFVFTPDHLRETVRRMTASMPVALSLAFPPDFVHAQRSLGVGIGVLCQLEAEVPFQAEALRRLTGEWGPPRPRPR
ncbi:ABC1 kinase family protein [Actinocorallia populi]|uniref:ABC1 kinase family protein n=1 Tax=Actinocorallia populi TaxID=2079200 RepID=UPI001E590AC7|nr:AarF/ABC1/UbiB kinase family protein [Actinocorallia populi]